MMSVLSSLAIANAGNAKLFNRKIADDVSLFKDDLTFEEWGSILGKSFLYDLVTTLNSSEGSYMCTKFEAINVLSGDWNITAKQNESCIVLASGNGTFNLSGPVSVLTNGGRFDAKVNFDLGKQAPFVVYAIKTSYGTTTVECSGKAKSTYDQFLGANVAGVYNNISFKFKNCPSNVTISNGPADILHFKNQTLKTFKNLTYILHINEGDGVESITTNSSGGAIDVANSRSSEAAKDERRKKTTTIVVSVVVAALVVGVVAFIVSVFYIPALSPVYNALFSWAGPAPYTSEVKTLDGTGQA